MKKILVPTDFSACAKAAEVCALDLAKKLKAELVFLHILLTPVDWSKLSKEQEDFYPETQKEIAKAKDYLNSLLKSAENYGLVAHKLIVYSNGGEKIHKFIQSEKIDFVVMGSHGQYGLRDHILGSNTYSMIRRSDVPVIIVKEGQNNLKLENIVFATNLKEDTGQYFKSIEKFAKIVGASLKILYVNTPTYFLETNDILKLGESFLKNFADESHEIFIQDAFREERGIIQFSVNQNADSIALVTYGKSDLVQYFNPSITENLIAMSHLPVISMLVKK